MTHTKEKIENAKTSYSSCPMAKTINFPRAGTSFQIFDKEN